MRLRDFDLREIDAPDQRSHFALKYVGRLEAVLAALRKGLPPGGLVLEVGCAQGNSSLRLAEEGFRAVALDLLPQAVGYALKKRECGTLWGVCGSVEALPLRDACCDGIYVGELLEHCAEPAEMLQRAARCLKPGGVMVITTMNGEWFGSPDATYREARGRVAGPVRLTARTPATLW